MTVFAERAGDVLARAGRDSRSEEAQLSGPRLRKGHPGRCSGGRASTGRSPSQGFRLKDVKGLHYLAHLLRYPGREYHVLDLAAAGQAVQAGGPPAHSPALPDHLDTTIHTGTFCSYTPDPRAPDHLAHLTYRTSPVPRRGTTVPCSVTPDS